VSLVRNKRLKSYNEPMLDNELKNTIIKQTSTGWRVDHMGRKTNDIVITVGMGALEALRGEFGSVELPDDNTFALKTKFGDVLHKEF
jgi:hypothetical protein